MKPEPASYHVYLLWNLILSDILEFYEVHAKAKIAIVLCSHLNWCYPFQRCITSFPVPRSGTSALQGNSHLYIHTGKQAHAHIRPHSVLLPRMLELKIRPVSLHRYMKLSFDKLVGANDLPHRPFCSLTVFWIHFPQLDKSESTLYRVTVRERFPLLPRSH